MNKKTTCVIAGILSAAVVAASGVTAMAADVDVYAEGAFTATDLVVYIYADINTVDPLVSAGVQLTYDNSKLTLTSAAKNEADWYFGTPTQKYSYQDPQDTGSTVIFLCGKIDEGNPTAGVVGTRKLVGKATFTRTESTAPGTSPETYFGSALTLGITRTDGGEFANFVTTGEEVLDNGGVSYAVKIRKRGDVNGDGIVTGADSSAAKYYITNGIDVLHPWMDCNADGILTGSDRSCIKYIITH